MNAGTMSNPLEKIKRIKSLDEALTRSSQAIAAFREQRKGGIDVPSDEAFARLVVSAEFRSTPIIAETLWQKFFSNGSEKFFSSFRSPESAAETYRRRFGAEACDQMIAAAEKICDGRIDLMGMKNLFVGTDIDWHREPVSSKRSPLKHWKQFDDLDSSETGNKKILWELNRHQHFFTLGLAFWLTGDERFGATFARHISSWMDENPPGMGINWASSLEVAFRSMSWIWAFHFFRESEHFTPDLFHRALKFLYLHGRHIERYLSTYYSPNTHITGEALGLYYLGTQLPFIGRAAAWRKTGEDILLAEMSRQVLSDGVYFEQSTWYQRYTVDFCAHFVVLRDLVRVDGLRPEAVDLKSRLELSLDFLQTITQPNGSTPLIGDDDGGRMLPLTTASSDDLRGNLALGAVIFDRGDYKYVSGAASEELFWLLGPESVGAYEELEAAEPQTTSIDFPEGGYCVMRDGWTDTDNYLIVDCGEVGSLAGGHGHADALAIEVAVRGKTLLVDSGTYTYHETRELRDYFRSTAAHNTLEIDGKPSSECGSPFNWRTRAECRRKSWISTPRFDFFAGEHNGYERLESPATHERSILFLKNDYWIVRDVVDTDGDHDYSLNFHFDSDIRTSISHVGDFVGGDGHRIYTFGDNGRWDQKESWISKNHGNKVNAPFVRFVSRGSGKQEFFTFILPTDSEAKQPELAEFDLYLARAFVIKFEGYTDMLVVNDDPAYSSTNGIFDSNFQYSWARFAADRSVPEELVLIGGSRFTLSGNRVFDDERIEFASMRRLGNELNIRTPDGPRTIELRFVDRRTSERRKPGNDRRKAES